MLRLFVSISERERERERERAKERERKREREREHYQHCCTPFPLPHPQPSRHLLYLDAALGYVPNRSREVKLNKIRQKSFNFSYEMKLNASHSLYLWKTLLTKSDVAGFQLWVSSLAAFCLANRRFSLLRDKEVDVRWLVLVLGCQLTTCSDTRQGSRSLHSTVSYVLHMQRCCCLVPFSVLRL